MAGEKSRNLPASIRQRLLNVAKNRGDAFDLILARYALERLLYRLSVSSHSERFLLKGALMFVVWGIDDHRPTRDADLLGSGASDPATIAAVFKEICLLPAEDGIAFDPASVASAPIAEEKVYAGVRVTMRADLAAARIPVQIDIGFGDAVTPGPKIVDYPVLLDAPAPRLRAYPVETVVAEKLHAITVLGMDNTRMKDFYDLKTIQSRFQLERELLGNAIAATFDRRNTPLPGALPIALGSEFASDDRKRRQWTAFLGRDRLEERANTLEYCQARIVELIGPALESARQRKN